MKKLFNNTFNYTRFILKRERVNSSVWLVILFLLTFLVGIAFNNIFVGSREDVIGMAGTMKNPAMIAMVGPVYAVDEQCIESCQEEFPDDIYQICPDSPEAQLMGLDLDICINPHFLECKVPCYDNYNGGVMYSQMMLVFVAIAAGAMNIFLVVNHTRKDEELGRAEVVRSLPVGRLSNLASALITAVIVNAILAVVLFIGLYTSSLDGISLTGSMLYGASVAVIGLFFASVAAIFSQAASTSRGALSYSFVTIGVLYLLRGVGDLGNNALSYISPLGLILRTRIFYSNNWLPVLIILILSIILAVCAFYLNRKRDLGAGLIPAKPGKKEASNLLKTPIGFTLRLLKGTLIGWSTVFLIFGVSYGSVFGDIEGFIGTNEMLGQIFLQNPEFSIVEQFMSTILTMGSILVTVPVIMCLLKIRSEEKAGRLETIYSKPVSKRHMFVNYLAVAFDASILFILMFTTGMWAAAAAVVDDLPSLLTIILAGFAYLPAIWFMLSITALLIAYWPKMTSLVWGLLGVFFLMSYLEGLLNIPSWLAGLVPFSAVPDMPIEPMSWGAVIILSALSIIITLIAVAGYGKRDLINE